MIFEIDGSKTIGRTRGDGWRDAGAFRGHVTDEAEQLIRLFGETIDTSAKIIALLDPGEAGLATFVI